MVRRLVSKLWFFMFQSWSNCEAGLPSKSAANAKAVSLEHSFVCSLIDLWSSDALPTDFNGRRFRWSVLRRDGFFGLVLHFKKVSESFCVSKKTFCACLMLLVREQLEPSFARAMQDGDSAETDEESWDPEAKDSLSLCACFGSVSDPPSGLSFFLHSLSMNKMFFWLCRRLHLHIRNAIRRRRFQSSDKIAKLLVWV